MTSPPTWLNKSFCKSAILGNIEVESFDVYLALPPGSNYISDVFRVPITYTDSKLSKQKISLFIKSPNAKAAQYTAEMGVVITENNFYLNILPLFNKFNKGIPLTPKYYYSLQNYNIFAIEDLSESGYVMANRDGFIDYNHCTECIKVIAKFHAVSVVVEERYPSVTEEAGSRGYFCNLNLRKIVDACLLVLANEVELFPELKHYATKLRNYNVKIWDLMKITARKKIGRINVLNHGDAWINNFMFKYGSNNEIIDVKLIDFQLLNFGSPGFDLQMFLTSAPNLDVRENRLDDLLTLYLDIFNRTLEDCGSLKKLTSEELYEEFSNADCVGIFTVAVTMLLTLVEPTSSENSCEEEEFCLDNVYSVERHPYINFIKKTTRYRKVLPVVLDYFDKRGLFSDS